MIFQVFVLKLKAPEPRDGSPEVIVKTTRKIFSPVVRSGESVPRAVIPLDVEDLADVTPSMKHSSHQNAEPKKKSETKTSKMKKDADTCKGSGDLQDGEDQRPRTRPPLPSSPSSQRKPQPKETAPSIRIMIQRYNMKINEEGNLQKSPIPFKNSCHFYRILFWFQVIHQVPVVALLLLLGDHQ